MDFIEDIEEYNEAMDNAYLVVTGRRSLESFTKTTAPMLALNFNAPTHIIEVLMDHYSDMENYERCDELAKIRNV
tara:strand:- start:15979 stop:16203 length:225 start_codon:yes stop_codon:yes gene_type:complete